MKYGLAQFQLGKAGITENFVKTVDSAFKTRKVVKIKVLRSLAPTKAKVEELSKELSDKLETPNRYINLGFTITLKKVSRQS